ncbi:hypothetical protein PIB30_023443 [Stylosanthes scabra]|uniref:Uncharacterized protein n=1 Tax=Stylosanthes scabra TaxID=79078 RepID=A0ABU6Z711_9FABA|nr:hypothetical protein [Stylosanthes scabra]
MRGPIVIRRRLVCRTRRSVLKRWRRRQWIRHRRLHSGVGIVKMMTLVIFLEMPEDQGFVVDPTNGNLYIAGSPRIRFHFLPQQSFQKFLLNPLFDPVEPYDFPLSNLHSNPPPSPTHTLNIHRYPMIHLSLPHFTTICLPSTPTHTRDRLEKFLLF